MKLAGRIILWILGWPVFVGWLFPLLAFCLGLARGLEMDDGILEATWRDWVAKTPRRWLAVIRWPLGRIHNVDGVEHRTLWRYSTALAAGHIFQPNPSLRTRKHERVHYRQALGLVLLGLALGLIVSGVEDNWWWLFGLWVPPGLAAYKLPNYLVPLLEGNNIYRDAEHERSAYAQTDLDLTSVDGKSWLDRHTTKERR